MAIFETDPEDFELDAVLISPKGEQVRAVIFMDEIGVIIGVHPSAPIIEHDTEEIKDVTMVVTTKTRFRVLMPEEEVLEVIRRFRRYQYNRD